MPRTFTNKFSRFIVSFLKYDQKSKREVQSVDPSRSRFVTDPCIIVLDTVRIPKDGKIFFLFVFPRIPTAKEKLRLCWWALYFLSTIGRRNGGIWSHQLSFVYKDCSWKNNEMKKKKKKGQTLPRWCREPILPAWSIAFVYLQRARFPILKVSEKLSRSHSWCVF